MVQINLVEGRTVDRVRLQTRRKTHQEMANKGEDKKISIKEQNSIASTAAVDEWIEHSELRIFWGWGWRAVGSRTWWNLRTKQKEVKYT